MKEYLIEFLNLYDYPKDASSYMMQCYDKLISDEYLKCEFNKLLDCYEERKDCDFSQLIQTMADLSAKAGIHEYTGYFLLMICLSKTLKRYYTAVGIEEQVWFSTMLDLKWKLVNCKCIHDVWGTFIPDWYGKFFHMSAFGFGKLQFEVKPFWRNYEKAGVVLTQEDRVINVHIPRTGTKLDRESQKDAYAQACRFFRRHFSEWFMNKPLVFVCRSWLLFQRHKEILSPQSNLYAFISDYDIIEQGLYEDYTQVWRLFDMYYNDNADQLPQDSSLRRTYANWIRNGEKTGWGYGVYIYRDVN